LYNVDLSATLCDLLGIPVPSGWDGISFEAQMRGEQEGGHDHLVWDHGLYAVQRAVRTRTHLMIRTYDDGGYGFPAAQLYDVEQDPYQVANMACEQPGVVSECYRLMAEWVAEELARDRWPEDPLMAVLRERGGR
jgi:choline-sulfatase